MLMRLTSPAQPHHPFVRADILLLTDAMVENDFSEDEEIEAEEHRGGNRLAYPHRTGFRPVSRRLHSPCHSVNSLDRNS